ncbi:MAG: phage baseplate assembly protein V [Gemmatimonas sp.]
MNLQHGVLVAVVVSRDDPDQQGRIRVKYSWLAGDPVSAWAPIASPLAGPGRGLWFMPEVDDEVLVAFEKGHFDYPFVVGFLWNGVHQPPDTDFQHRIIVTPGGNELRFEDNDNNKQIILKTAGNHAITLSDETGASRISIESSNGQLVEIDDVANSITLRGGGRILKLAGGQVAIS